MVLFYLSLDYSIIINFTLAYRLRRCRRAIVVISFGPWFIVLKFIIQKRLSSIPVRLSLCTILEQNMLHSFARIAHYISELKSKMYVYFLPLIQTGSLQMVVKNNKIKNHRMLITDIVATYVCLAFMPAFGINLSAVFINF